MNGSRALLGDVVASTDVSHCRPGSVAVVFGTRPEIIKLGGIIELLGAKARTIFSGQHFDQLLSQVFFEDLRLPPPDVVLSIGGRSRSQQLGELVLRLEEQFAGNCPAVVVVQGDTTTALGGALAANAMDIPLVHVEAGLRSFDRRMPEEHNRVVADHLADLCLAPTEQARQNLLAERIPESRIAVTGNTVVDVATRLIPCPDERATLLKTYALTAGAFILATFHRPENVDDGDRLGRLLSCLEALPLPVLFPVHPRTQKHIDACGVVGRASGVALVPPLGYKSFLGLAAECALMVSDSGGVQEEASVIKRPAVVVRRSTERPEVLGTFATLVSSLTDLPAVVNQLLAQIDTVHRRLADIPSPYGDGHASIRCLRQIARVLESTAGRTE